MNCSTGISVKAVNNLVQIMLDKVDKSLLEAVIVFCVRKQNKKRLLGFIPSAIRVNWLFCSFGG
jgi:hypothetical protein